MKAQTKAILASLVVIAVALSAVSGVTYSWWSDSENTDITVGTGNLDVEVSNISYGMESGSSGFFTVKEESPKYEGETASLSLITGLSNVAPNDVYYIDYTVQFTTTVYAQYLIDFESSVEWITIEVFDIGTAVGQGNVSAGKAKLHDWTYLPSEGTPLEETPHSDILSVRVEMTIADNAPMNTDYGYLDGVVSIVNKITQSGNAVNGTEIGPENKTMSGMTSGDISLPIKATFENPKGTGTFKYSASSGTPGAKLGDNVILTFTLEDSNGIPVEFDSATIEITMPGELSNKVFIVDASGDIISKVAPNEGVVTFVVEHFSDYAIFDTEIDVGNDLELSAALALVKGWKTFWNTPVTINLAPGTYYGDHEVYQYPEWKGEYLNAPSANYTDLVLVGTDSVTFTGQFTTYGALNAKSVNKDYLDALGKASTTISNIVFDGSSIASVDGDVVSVNMLAASSGVTFEGCTFKDMTHVVVGKNGDHRAGKIVFDDCVVKACISGYVVELTVVESEIQNINNQTGGNISVSDCDISVVHSDDVTEEKSRYVFRLNAGNEVEVERTNIKTNGNLQVVRGEGVSISYTDCVLEYDAFVFETKALNDVTITIDGIEQIFNSRTLGKAIENGKEELELHKGTYAIPASATKKTLTITGSGPETIIEVVPAGQREANGQLDYNFDGSTVTFNNLTIKTNDATYAGYARLTGTYIDCTFINTYCLGGVSKFNNCTFNLTPNNYLWTYGAPEVTFENCTFNTKGKAILIYSEAGSLDQTVNIKDCKFNASEKNATSGNGWCAAVEIDSRLVSGYTVNFSGNNVVDDDFNGLYRLKNSKTVINVSVTIGGVSQNVEVSPDSENQL